jgi:cyclohexanone monooxygenase
MATTKTGRAIDPGALKQKYAEERDKRLGPQGGRQYRLAIDDYPELIEDPWAKAPSPRAAVSEDVDALVVGGGMSGIMTAGRLMQNGVTNLRLIERGADYGGTWYWNRYPGAQCDTESYIYMPLLDESGYVPTQKYAGQPELQSYFKQVADQLGLTERALFRTKANSFTWDEGLQRWIVRTDRGDEIRARFIALCVGNLAQPKLPAIEGIKSFKGHMFLTARWDYDYTGGSASAPQLTNLRDKRAAIIGTGASAVQAIPHLAEWAKELFVFQRTPSMINYRGNTKTDPEWAKSLKPGWQEERMKNFEEYVFNPAGTERDLVADGWTDLARSLANVDAAKEVLQEPCTDLAELMQIADFIKMEESRERVDQTVSDPATAEGLKAYYNVHCKRPTFHDEYLPAFNKPNVTLVDTGGKGVERITEKGVVVGGREYEVDCVIFSTGFEAATPTYLTGEYTLTGVGGRSLEDKWNQQFTSLHGMLTHGFPNMILVGHVRDGGGSFNATYPFMQQANHAAALIATTIGKGASSFDVTPEAEARWRQTMKDKTPPIQQFLSDCTPGYLNNEGNPDGSALRLSLYGGGVIEYANVLREWREGGGLERDLELAKPRTKGG